MSIMGILLLANMSLNAYRFLTTKEQVTHTILSFMLLLSNVSLHCGIFVVAAVDGPNRMERFMTYFKQVEKVHTSVEKKSKPEGLEKLLTFKLVMGVIASFIASFMRIVFKLDIVHLGKFLILHILNTYVYVEIVVICFLALQIIFALTTISWSFKSLNKRVGGLHDGFLMNGKKIRHNAEIVNNIHSFCQIYASLIKLSKQVNSAEAHTIVMLFCNFFFRILLSLYFCITPITDKGTQTITEISSMLTNASSISHSLYTILFILMLVEPCHKTHQEMKKTKLLINEMLCCTESARDRVSEALISFYKIIECTEHVYVPYGMFNISRSFYLSFFGSVATFFIIIVQFRNLE